MVAKKLDSICKDYTKIENYDAAVSDTTQMWICHHRNEQYYTREDLIKMGLYYNCPPCELIFLTKHDHGQAHKTCAEAAKRKENISKTTKGHSSYTKGRKHSEEEKKKISETCKNLPKWVYKKSAESRKHNFYKCIETGEIHSSSEWISLGYRAYRLAAKGLHFSKCNNGRVQLS